MNRWGMKVRIWPQRRTLPQSGLQRALTLSTVVGLGRRSIAGIGAGIIAIFWSSITDLVLVYVFAVRALFTGILGIIPAIRLREEIKGEWLLMLGSLASIVFTVSVRIRPAALRSRLSGLSVSTP